jgi:hypothetical protein
VDEDVDTVDQKVLERELESEASAECDSEVLEEEEREAFIDREESGELDPLCVRLEVLERERSTLPLPPE